MHSKVEICMNRLMQSIHNNGSSLKRLVFVPCKQVPPNHGLATTAWSLRVALRCNIAAINSSPVISTPTHSDAVLRNILRQLCRAGHQSVSCLKA
jgi:hypothetical protein